MPLTERPVYRATLSLLIVLASLATGGFMIYEVLTGAIEPEVGSAVGAIAAATIGVIAFVLRRPSAEPTVTAAKTGGSTSALK
jgi:hypothetical protein